MGRWSICRGRTHSGGTREPVGGWWTNDSTICEVFRDHFNYRHQVDNKNNRNHSPISVEGNWATKYCTNRFHAYFLVSTEVNVNYLYEVPGRWNCCGTSVVFSAPVGMGDGWEHTLWRDRSWGGFGRRLRSRKGALGDHELVTAPKYCVKLLVDDNKWEEVQAALPKADMQQLKRKMHFFTKRYCRCTKRLLLCA